MTDCDDCAKRYSRVRGRELRVRHMLERAAAAHGWQLWFRPGVPFDVLAVPDGPSHGSPEDVIQTLREFFQPEGLLPHERADAAQRESRRLGAVARPPHPSGRPTFRIDGPYGQPVEVQFLFM